LSLTSALVLVLSFKNLVSDPVVRPFDHVLIPLLLISAPILVVAFVSQFVRRSDLTSLAFGIDLMATLLPLLTLASFWSWLADHR